MQMSKLHIISGYVMILPCPFSVFATLIEASRGKQTKTEKGQGNIITQPGTVWDPHCIYLEEQLEKVQKRVARFVLNNYSYEEGSISEIMETLQWKPLKERRRENRLILFYKGLNGQAKIPTTVVQMYFKTTEIDTTSNSTFHTPESILLNTALYQTLSEIGTPQTQPSVPEMDGRLVVKCD